MLELALEYRGYAHNVFTWVVCLAALRWGGGPERAFAIIWLFSFKVVHFSYHAVLDVPIRLDQLDLFHASLDLFVAMALTLLALNANRFYTLWIASFQLIALSAHLVRELVDAITPLVYAILVIAPSYFQLIIFAGGLIAHVRRKRRFGTYRDWRDPSWASLAGLRSKFASAGPGRHIS